MNETEMEVFCPQDARPWEENCHSVEFANYTAISENNEQHVINVGAFTLFGGTSAPMLVMLIFVVMPGAVVEHAQYACLISDHSRPGQVSISYCCNSWIATLLFINCHSLFMLFLVKYYSIEELDWGTNLEVSLLLPLDLE